MWMLKRNKQLLNTTPSLTNLQHQIYITDYILIHQDICATHFQWKSTTQYTYSFISSWSFLAKLWLLCQKVWRYRSSSVCCCRLYSTPWFSCRQVWLKQCTHHHLCEFCCVLVSINFNQTLPTFPWLIPIMMQYIWWRRFISLYVYFVVQSCIENISLRYLHCFVGIMTMLNSTHVIQVL
jgi:hypothetical protein